MAWRVTMIGKRPNPPIQRRWRKRRPDLVRGARAYSAAFATPAVRVRVRRVTNSSAAVG